MAVGVGKTVVKFKFGTSERTLDYRKVPMPKWRELKAILDFNQSTLFTNAAQGDVDAVYAIVWLERTQRERQLNYATVLAELDSLTDDVDFEFTYVSVNGDVIKDDRRDALPVGRRDAIDGEVVDDGDPSTAG